MTMKRLVSLILMAIIIITAFCFTGCDATVELRDDPVEVPQYWGMQRIDWTGSFEIYREPVTDILYILYDFSNEAGLSVMYDTDGKPLTYERFLELQNSTN